MDTSEDILQQASPDLVRGPETKRAAKSARLSPSFISWLQAGPMMLVFFAFFLIPLVFVVIVSFWDYNEYQLLPAFSGRGYTDTFEGCIAQLPDLCTIAKTYVKTLKFCFMVWAITLFIGFWVAYFLAFHIKSKTWQMGLSLLCTIPFWTSNVIRMIAWIPLLGRNGLVNSGLMKVGPDQPSDRMAAVLRILGGAGAGSPLHLLHGGADLQLDGAHRQVADRGRV